MACLSIKPCSDDNKETVVVSPSAPLWPISGNLAPYLFIRSIEPGAYLDLQKKSLTKVFDGIQLTSLLDDFSTSCSYNVIALMTLFSGVDKAKQIHKRLSTSRSNSFKIAYEGTLPKYRLKMADLFTGRCMAELRFPIEQEIPEDLFKQKERACRLKFLHFMKPIFRSCFKDASDNPEESFEWRMGSIISSIDFSFNKKTIDFILSDFKKNSIELSDRDSFVYYFLIGGGVFKLYHMFCVEQFFFPKQPLGLFRVYQAWVDKMTLPEYFKRKGYGDEVEGCLNYEEISKLFGNIDLILLNQNRKAAPSEQELSELHQQCFEVASQSPFIPVYFFPKKKTLGGLSLRYVCDKIRPGDCIDHFHEFMTS